MTVDYLIPNGFEYLTINDNLSPSWTEENSSLAIMMTSELILPGETDSVCIYLAVTNVSTGEVTEESWTTVAEITEYLNENNETKTTDADSTPDGDFNNDPGGNPDDNTDDVVDGDGTGNPDDPSDDINPELDEDDNDPAKIVVCDIASIIYTDDVGPHLYGDTIKYIIEIHNQGNGPITNVELQDLYGDGFEYLTTENQSAGWIESTDGELVVIVDEVIETGDTLEVCLLMEVSQDLTPTDSSWLHLVEVVQFEDADNPGEPKTDIDSMPDDNPENDSGGNPDDNTDDETDGNGFGDPSDSNNNSDPELDEDDHDPVSIEIFDLALYKTTIQDTVYKPGDQVVFDINVVNQGNVSARDITITDYLRDCLLYTSPSPRDRG